MGSFSYSFLLVFAKKAGFQVIFVPVLYLIFTLVAAFFSLPFGRLADKVGRKGILMTAYMFWILVCLLFIFNQGFFAIIVGFVFYGFHKAALDPAQRTFVSELAPEGYRASSLGVFQMVTGLLWDKIGVRSPFYLSLGLTVLSAGILIFVKETQIEPT